MAIGTDLYNTFFGTNPEFKQAPSNFDPNQLAALQKALGMGIEGLGTDKIEEAARRGYRQSTIPLLQERFAQAGGIGSSGYQNALKQEGSLLETQLAALRQGNAMDLLRLGLTPTQDYVYDPGRQGVGQDLIKLAADAGLAYATGGLSKAPGILDLFRKLLGDKGDAQTDIASEASDPVQQRLANQSGRSLMQAPLRNMLGVPSTVPAKSTTFGQYQAGGTKNILDLLGQAAFYGAGRNAPGSRLEGLMGKVYPGFEL